MIVDDPDTLGEGVGEEDMGEPSQSQSKEPLESFGTLSISEHGISRFFGPTGGSEVRLS